MMRPIHAALIFVVVTVSAAVAQQRPAAPAYSVPRFDLSLGYNGVDANAPPGSCDCFGINGGYASLSYRITDWLGAAGEVTGGHADNISMLGQNLTLLTFLAGPRVSFTGHRLVPYGQVLLGGAHGSDSYFPTPASSSDSASSWALSAGGGLDVNLTRRLAIRALRLEYLRTAFPNGGSNEQNQLAIGAGLVIKFGGRDEAGPPVAAAARPSDIAFSCGTDVSNLDQGDVLEVIGNTMTRPDSRDVTYSWSSTGGTIEGSGRVVRIHTAGMAPGAYRVSGRVSLVSDPSVTANCETTFRVNPRVESAPPAAPPALSQAVNAEQDRVFHQHVPDVFFDYDSYQLRSDALAKIYQAAQYLKAHPEIHVLISGYADERGTAEYNLALGAKRATAAREAFIVDGVDPSQLEVISFGKEAQVCTAEDESCWQRNRRAAFALHP